MLDNFREIYNCELEHYGSGLEYLILSSTEVRMFVYEVCKNYIASQQGDPADRKNSAAELKRYTS